MASTWQTLDNVLVTVRNLTGKDTTTLPDSVLLPIANKYYYLIVRELVGLNEDLYAEISSADLVVNQREYALPIDDTATVYGGGAIKIQRVEISYNGTTWNVATPKSLQEFETPTILDADLNKYTYKNAPVYWFKDRSIWLAPVPSSSDSVSASNAGLRIYWVKRPNEIAAASVPDMPKDWLAALQEGILYDVYRKFSRGGEATDAKQNYYAMVQRMRELEQNIDEEQRLDMRAVHKSYN